MTIFFAAILGLVQGLCEFLPVSSSGHLVLLQTVFGIDEGALFFGTMLHVATLIAVVAVYYKELWALLRRPFQKKVLMLLIATLVTTAIAFLLRDVLGDAFEGRFLGFGFIVTAAVLILSDKLSHGKKTAEKMSALEAAGVGLAQGIAIFPGISRSGSTIAGARLFGLSKEAAAEFSFMLSIPAILGSLVLQLPDVIKSGTGGVSAGELIVGMAFAAVSGYFAIRLMIKLITTKSLKGFAVYVAAVGVLVLADQFIFNLFFANPF